MTRLSPYRTRGVGYQIQHTKGISDMGGSGVVDYFQEKGEQLLDRAVRGRPKILENLIISEGNQIVSAIKVCRRPVTKAFEYILNLLTFGKMKKEMERLGYDNMFHLYLIVYLENGTVYSLEKNERVNVVAGEIEGGECEPIYTFGGATLEQFIQKSEDLNIENFYQYDTFSNNCQSWVLAILNANGISQFNSFVSQSVESLAPEYIKKFIKGLTNVAGVSNYIMSGGGEEEDEYENEVIDY